MLNLTEKVDVTDFINLLNMSSNIRAQRHNPCYWKYDM